MEKKIKITKRFRNNILLVYQYLLKEFSKKSADNFLKRLEKRIDFIADNPQMAKRRSKESMSEAFYSRRTIKFFIVTKATLLEILCLFDMRKNPKKKPY